MKKRGMRVVATRFGVIIDARGGVVKKMLPLYKAGLGAVLGSGKQWMSWVALQDLIRAIKHVLVTDIQGAVNVVSPHPVRQAEFSKKSGAACSSDGLFKNTCLYSARIMRRDGRWIASCKRARGAYKTAGFWFHFQVFYACRSFKEVIMVFLLSMMLATSVIDLDVSFEDEIALGEDFQEIDIQEIVLDGSQGDEDSEDDV